MAGRRGGGGGGLVACEHFEAILYGASYITLLPKPHENTAARLHTCTPAQRIIVLSVDDVFPSVCLVCLSVGLHRRARIRIQCTAHKHTAADTARLVQDSSGLPQKVLQGSPSASGLTATVGIIQQGILTRVSVLLSPSGLGLPLVAGVLHLNI